MEFSEPVSGLETVSRHVIESLVSVLPRTWTSSLYLRSWSRKVMVSKNEKSRDSKSWLGVGVKFWIWLFNASNANKDSIDFLGLNTFLIAFQQSPLFIHFGQFSFISVNVFKMRSWETKFCNKTSIFDNWLLSGRYLRFEKTSAQSWERTARPAIHYYLCYLLMKDVM